jgi:NAD(P)-dependent dehydrogenase (short-subunit alcohol dehydrogenase family)
VTGASSGIGHATARHLAAAGYPTVATARHPEALADHAAASCHTLALDVTDESSMTRAVRAVEEAHGGIAALINNAGYGEMGPLEEVPIAAFRRQLGTNVVGVLRLCQLVLPGMRRRGYGRIVHVSTLGGVMAMLGGGFVLAVVAAIAITGAVPSASQPPTDIIRYFAAHRLAALLAAWLGFPIVALFSAFATGVCDYLVALNSREGTSLRWAWAGALLSSAALLLASAIQAALAYHRITTPVIPFAYDLYNFALSVGSLTTWGWFMLMVSRSALRLRAFPTWLGWFGIAAAGINWLLSLSLFFQSGPLAPGGAAFFLYVVGLLWTIAVSLVLGRTAV